MPHISENIDVRISEIAPTIDAEHPNAPWALIHRIDGGAQVYVGMVGADEVKEWIVLSIDALTGLLDQIEERK